MKDPSDYLRRAEMARIRALQARGLEARLAWLAIADDCEYLASLAQRQRGKVAYHGLHPTGPVSYDSLPMN